MYIWRHDICHVTALRWCHICQNVSLIPSIRYDEAIFAVGIIKKVTGEKRQGGGTHPPGRPRVNRCRRRNYESPVEIFKPKMVLIVFWQYLSHLACSRVHPCCVEIRIARHVKSCCVTSRRVMSHYVTLCHIMSRHVTSCHVTSCHVMSSCHVMYLMSRHVTSCHITSCHVMSRHVMSGHVMSRHVTFCPVMSRHVISCYVISRRKSRDGHATNASLSTDFFHTQSIQIKHERVRWLSRRLPIQYRISGIWSSFFLNFIFFIQRSFSKTTGPILTKFSGIVYSGVVWIIR